MNNAAAKLIVETERLTIRELVEADAGFMNELLNTPSFIRYIGDRGIRTDAEARIFIRDRYRKSYEDNGYGLYAVDLRTTGVPIGICGWVRRDMLEGPDLGFAFLPEFEGRGYGTESAAAMLTYGRDILNFDQAFAITSLDNSASIKLLEKLGFSLEGMITPPDGDDLNLFSLDLHGRS